MQVQISRKKSNERDFETFVDPVCKMLVQPQTAVAKFNFKGETFYFCAVRCLTKFRQNPEKFLRENAKPEPMHRAADEYICPMCPEVLNIGPGVCPKCGMALEPKTITLDEKPDPEFLDMKRRFWISALLTLPVFALAMAEMMPDFHQIIAPEASL
jgi:Cu+-exporting ATPase